MSAPAAIYSTSIAHVRHTPLKNAFTYRSYSWYVDVDHLPRLPRLLKPLAGFRVADHLGDPEGTLRGNVERYLATQGIRLDGGRISMLASARVFGHVFNPLSLFWCHDAAGALRCVIAEVHNTYGERHAYLLHPDEAGIAVTGKDFHVSPFFDVTGTYGLRFTLSPDRVSTTVTLRHEGTVVFSAAFRGRPEPATRRTLARLLIRQPLMTHRVSALIRVHGIWLWLRGLPIRSHPNHIRQAGI